MVRIVQMCTLEWVEGGGPRTSQTLLPGRCIYFQAGSPVAHGNPHPGIQNHQILCSSRIHSPSSYLIPISIEALILSLHTSSAFNPFHDLHLPIGAECVSEQMWDAVSLRLD